MIHDSFCWLGALPILSVSKTIDPSYKSYGATRPYKQPLNSIFISFLDLVDLNPAVLLDLIKENDS